MSDEQVLEQLRQFLAECRKRVLSDNDGAEFKVNVTAVRTCCIHRRLRVHTLLSVHPIYGDFPEETDENLPT